MDKPEDAARLSGHKREASTEPHESSERRESSDEIPIPQLISLLTWAEDESAYRMICERLVKIGSPAVPDLMAALSAPEEHLRDYAANVLRVIGSPAAAAVPDLIAALTTSDDASVRARAAKVLGGLGGLAIQSVPALNAALTYASSRVRWEAADALGEIRDQAAIPYLIPALADPDHSVAAVAASALGKIGSSAAVDALIVALGPTSHIRSIAASALGDIRDPAAIPHLILALADVNQDNSRDSQDIRCSIAEALGEFGSLSATAVPAMKDALADPDPFIRERFAKALGEIRDPAAIPNLIAALSDPEYFVSAQVIEALGEIGAPATPALIEALKDADDEVRIRAANTLKRIGQPAIPGLKSARQHPDPNIRAAVLRILADLAPEDLIGGPGGLDSTSSTRTEEDERILAWFKDVHPKEYLEPLQLYWCIGQADRAAFESAGRALGYDRLQKRLKRLQPTFGKKRLNISNGYIRKSCLDLLDCLFDNEPFYSNAWSDEERELALRVEYYWGGRKESSWTHKARTALHYVDRYLSIKEWLPDMTVANS